MAILEIELNYSLNGAACNWGFQLRHEITTILQLCVVLRNTIIHSMKIGFAVNPVESLILLQAFLTVGKTVVKLTKLIFV